MTQLSPHQSGFAMFASQLVWLGPLLHLVTGAAAAPAAPPAAGDVGGRKQLFIDRRFIADSAGVELRVNPAQKLGPPLRDDRGEPLQGHISRVIDDGGKVRLYLGADSVEVLESNDGLSFRRTGVTIRGGGFTTRTMKSNSSTALAVCSPHATSTCPCWSKLGRSPIRTPLWRWISRIGSARTLALTSAA